MRGYYRDPTADLAIGRVYREQRNRERRDRRKKNAEELGKPVERHNPESRRGLQESPEKGADVP